MSSLTDSAAFRGRAADVGLAAVVLSVVSMMIVPLPTSVLDLLLTANIALGVLMLLVAMYVRSGLEFSSFPTILLVTTLFRLALNISSTRLVLLQADAGEVIRAFGEFVVRGNYVVGGVVFALITLVQFLVIAKGSERVAEVGARFTLDAMPGKQMSIDAELRTGAMDHATAKKRRSELSRESQFYGAMDGAMKFVKGDAVAGIVITLVNMIGGLIVGVAMHDMDVATSLRTYGLLTIGDGLVSQIPALLVSTSAGIVVTRVASEDEHASLGRDVASQIFGQPKALVVAGVFLGAMALVPGLPTLPFLVLGGLSLGLGRHLGRARASAASLALRQATESADARGTPMDAASTDRTLVPIVVPLGVDLAPSFEPRLASEGPALRESLERLRARVFADLGLLVPSVRVRFRADLPRDSVEVTVQEVPFVSFTADSALPRAELESRIELELERAVRRRAEDLLGLQDAHELVDRLERIYPALVKNVVPKPVPLPLLTEVLRRLVGEGVSIRPLREILEALSTHAPSERDPGDLVELVRASLRRHVTRPLVVEGALAAILVDPAIEETIRDAIRRTPNGTYLALPPQLAREIVAAARVATTSVDGARPHVVLAQSDVRRYLRRLVETELPDIRVLAYAELPPDVVVTPTGRIDL